LTQVCLYLTMNSFCSIKLPYKSQIPQPSKKDNTWNLSKWVSPKKVHDRIWTMVNFNGKTCPSYLFLFYFAVVLDAGTLWHLQKFLQNIRYITLEFTPSPLHSLVLFHDQSSTHKKHWKTGDAKPPSTARASIWMWGFPPAAGLPCVVTKVLSPDLRTCISSPPVPCCTYCPTTLSLIRLVCFFVLFETVSLGRLTLNLWSFSVKGVVCYTPWLFLLFVLFLVFTQEVMSKSQNMGFFCVCVMY
jgi:hypothetical protein